MSYENELSSIDYGARRKTFLSKIKGGVALFPAAPEVIRNNDVHHSYRQDSNLFYLTGFHESHTMCILDPQSKTPYKLFVHPKDKTKEMWEGKILGIEGAKTQLGANVAYSSSDEAKFEEELINSLVEAEVLYYRVGLDPQFDQRVFQIMVKACRKLGRTGRPLWPIQDPNDVLGEMRLVKSKAEIDRLQVAANITAEAHVNAMRLSKPGMYEYEVEAAIFHSFRACGAGRLGYGSIIASGANACTLHYVSNDRRMTDRDLLLIDAGAEFDYYTADITRTFPVGQRFTNEQREVYSSVLRAQKECIKMARPGKTQRELHMHAIEVLTEELKRLKVLKGTTASLIKSKAYLPYYPHGTGHWLGMDVHDVGKYYTESYDRPRKLEPGMCFTVEPGLYFGLDSKAPAKFKGIGVRIEDDVVITASGCKVLTSAAPKEIDEIESIRAST